MAKNIKVKLEDKEKLIFVLEEDAQKGDFIALKDSSSIDFSYFQNLVNKKEDEVIEKKLQQAELNGIDKFKASAQYSALLQDQQKLKQQEQLFLSQKQNIANEAIAQFKKQQEYLDLVQQNKQLQEQEIKLQNEIKQAVQAKELELQKQFNLQKEQDQKIISQQKLDLSQKENDLKNAFEQFKKQKEYLDLLNQIEQYKQELNQQALSNKQKLYDKDNEIKEIIKDKDIAIAQKQNQIENAVNAYKASAEYKDLLQKITNAQNQVNTTKLEVENQYKDQINQLNQQLLQQKAQVILKDNELKSMQNQITISAQSKQLEIQNAILQAKDNIIAQYKQGEEYQALQNSLKALEEENKQLHTLQIGQNVKLNGEELEQYILDKYNDFYGLSYQDARLTKTNETVDNTKPDFEFVVFDEKNKDEKGNEIVYGRVIIEAKNEMINSQYKRKNSDYYAKLAKDAKNRNADFAILVTTLEKEQEFSILMVNEYKNMFVVRPDWLLPLLSLLRVIFLKRKDIQAAQAKLIQSQELIKKFEDFKNSILNNAFKNIRKNMQDIENAANIIKKQAQDILDKQEIVVSTHMHTIENKIKNFSIKRISSQLDKLNADDEASNDEQLLLENK